MIEGTRWIRLFSESLCCVLMACGLGAIQAAGRTEGSHPRVSAVRLAHDSTTQALNQPNVSGKRDPFAVPKAPPPGTLLDAPEPLRASLPPGKKGLIIGQLRLEGVVQQENGMIAVVANRSNVAYFLRVSDQLYDGVVARITDRSIVFRETGRNGDRSREVIKRIGSSPGEN